MYEQYYSLIEPPFSLTPDPKYFYRSESHDRAFALLQYAIQRREGFMIVYGEIGTGKTTLCRAVLDTIGKNVYTALLLNPFLTEEDLLKRLSARNMETLDLSSRRYGATATGHSVAAPPPPAAALVRRICRDVLAKRGFRAGQHSYRRQHHLYGRGGGQSE